MSFNQKMMGTKLRGIQVGVDDIGNKLFAQNEQLGSDLKMFAFEIGMCRAALDKEFAQLSSNSDYEAAQRVLREFYVNYDGSQTVNDLQTFVKVRLHSCKATNVS